MTKFKDIEIIVLETELQMVYFYRRPPSVGRSSELAS